MAVFGGLKTELHNLVDGWASTPGNEPVCRRNIARIVFQAWHRKVNRAAIIAGFAASGIWVAGKGVDRAAVPENKLGPQFAAASLRGGDAAASVHLAELVAFNASESSSGELACLHAIVCIQGFVLIARRACRCCRRCEAAGCGGVCGCGNESGSRVRCAQRLLAQWLRRSGSFHGVCLAGGSSRKRKHHLISSHTPTETLVAEIPKELQDVLYLDGEVKQLQQSKRRRYRGTDQARVLTRLDFIKERESADTESAAAKAKKAAKTRATAKGAAAAAEGKEAKAPAESKAKRAPSARKAKPRGGALAEDSENASSEDESSSGGSDSDVVVARSFRKSQLMFEDGTVCCSASPALACSFSSVAGDHVVLELPDAEFGWAVALAADVSGHSRPNTTNRTRTTRCAASSPSGTTTTARATSRRCCSSRRCCAPSILSTTALACRRAPLQSCIGSFLGWTTRSPVLATLLRKTMERRQRARLVQQAALLEVAAVAAAVKLGLPLRPALGPRTLLLRRLRRLLTALAQGGPAVL